MLWIKDLGFTGESVIAYFGRRDGPQREPPAAFAVNRTCDVTKIKLESSAGFKKI